MIASLWERKLSSRRWSTVMSASQARTFTGRWRAGRSTARGAEGESHSRATDTATHASCPALTAGAAPAAGVTRVSETRPSSSAAAAVRSEERVMAQV